MRKTALHIRKFPTLASLQSTPYGRAGKSKFVLIQSFSWSSTEYGTESQARNQGILKSRPVADVLPSCVHMCEIPPNLLDASRCSIHGSFFKDVNVGKRDKRHCTIQ